MNSMFLIASHADLGRACYALYDDDTEHYHVYNGPDWHTADFIGEAFTVAGAKIVAREYFNELTGD